MVLDNCFDRDGVNGKIITVVVMIRDNVDGDGDGDRHDDGGDDDCDGDNDDDTRFSQQS